MQAPERRRGKEKYAYSIGKTGRLDGGLGMAGARWSSSDGGHAD